MRFKHLIIDFQVIRKKEQYFYLYFQNQHFIWVDNNDVKYKRKNRIDPSCNTCTCTNRVQTLIHKYTIDTSHNGLNSQSIQPIHYMRYIMYIESDTCKWIFNKSLRGLLVTGIQDIIIKHIHIISPA